MTKEVCSVASCTSTSTAFEKTVRALAICCPPLDSPVWSAPPPAVSTACEGCEGCEEGVEGSTRGNTPA
eukprot:scaffold5651_cov18-Phaeocystis_antarctica.AAC.1